MADDSSRFDPKGVLETVPPPHGAKDPYSAATRVGTLPEHVLEAMRRRETDASIQKRTKSGMRESAVRPLAAPPVPTFDAAPSSVAPPDSKAPPLPWSRLATPRAVRPSGAQRAAPPSLPRASPLAPLALETPQEGWLTVPEPPSARSMQRVPTPLPLPLPLPTTLAPLVVRARPRSVWRSLLVIAVFALLGALVAAALTIAGY